jgi:hypothetical protein
MNHKKVANITSTADMHTPHAIVTTCSVSRGNVIKHIFSSRSRKGISFLGGHFVFIHQFFDEFGNNQNRWFFDLPNLFIFLPKLTVLRF